MRKRIMIIGGGVGELFDGGEAGRTGTGLSDAGLGFAANLHALAMGHLRSPSPRLPVRPGRNAIRPV